MRDPDRAVDVLGKHLARQSIFGVVCALDYLFLCLELRYDTNRAEDLFAHNLHVGLHVSEDGGFDKVSGTFDSCASSDYTSALLNTMLNVAEDALGEEVGVK